jgi:hypothetical protein
LALCPRRGILFRPWPRTTLSGEGERGEVRLVGDAIEASIRKRGYVSGIEARAFLDVKTGFRDVGFGLDIVDWLMEAGSDEAYRNRLPPDF